MTREICFFVPVKFPSMNELVAKSRSNPYAGSAQKRHYSGLAESYARHAADETGWEAPDGPVEVRLTWVESDHRRDQDNITSAQKFLLDGLVEAGVIRDDSQRYVPQPSVNRIATDKDNPGVWVHIRRQ